MDKILLVMNVFESGKRIVNALSKTNFNFDAALWLYNPESSHWNLIIASEELDHHGPRVIYQHIHETLKQENLNSLIDFSDISLVSPYDPLIQSLKNFRFETGQESEFRLTQITLGNSYIEDAYIYKISK
ncbi:hypothetical protein ABEY80_22015 [Priestia megaterium]